MYSVAPGVPILGYKHDLSTSSPSCLIQPHPTTSFPPNLPIPPHISRSPSSCEHIPVSAFFKHHVACSSDLGSMRRRGRWLRWCLRLEAMIVMLELWRGTGRGIFWDAKGVLRRVSGRCWRKLKGGGLGLFSQRRTDEHVLSGIASGNVALGTELC